MENTIEVRDLTRKIKILMVARLVIATFAMIGGVFFLQAEKIPFFAIVASCYFFTLIYALVLRYFNVPHFVAYLQLVVDVILETTIIHYAGGVNSIYAFLYAPSIVASGVILSGNAAKTIAGISSVLYAGISGLEYFRIVPLIGPAETIYAEGLWYMLFIVSFRIILFCLIGYLSSYLSIELYAKRAELAHLRNLSDIILKNISSGVLTLNTALNVIYANPSAKDILGREEKEIWGRPLSNLLWRESHQDTIKTFIAAAKSRNGVEIEIRNKEGKKITLKCSYADIIDDNNEIIGGVLTFYDLTVLKELELEMRQREKISAMGEMAIAIAHEIRNPMSAVKGAFEVLKERGCFEANGGKLVEVIFKELDRLNRTIEDFLRYARERRPDKHFENLGWLIDEVWLLVRQDDRWHKGISMVKKFGNSDIIVKIDPDQIKQVFYNLFINALEAMPGGGRITVGASEEKDLVVIDVSDTGIGMSTEDLNKIYQNHYSTKSYGMGLGLAITRRILESHHGLMQIKSQQGKGTTVVITLPK